MVVYSHYFLGFVSARPGSVLAYLLKPFDLMWAGVDLFFVLSGFLIFSILLRGGPGTFKSFYPRRAARVLPLYALLLIILVVGLRVQHSGLIHLPRLFEEVDQLWLYFCMLQNFDQLLPKGGFNWLVASWSLAIEEQFYLIAPILIYVIGKGNRLAGFLIGTIVTSVVFRSFLAVQMASLPTELFDWTYYHSLSRLDGLAVGGLIAWLWVRPAWADRIRRSTSLLVLTACTGLAYCVLALRLRRSFSPEIFLVLAATSGAILCLALVRSPLVSRFLRLSALKHAGRISFGLYMIHIPVLGILSGLFYSRTAPIVIERPRWITLVALIVAVLLAEFSYRFLELPVLERVRKMFPYVEGTAGNRGKKRPHAS